MEKGIPIKNMARFYDIYAPTEGSKYREKQINVLNLNSGEKVLDVGCGTGSLTVLAKNKVGDKGEVIGLDLSQEMIEKSRKKAEKYNLNIKFIQGSIDDLVFPDNYFDAVISSWMFHHLPIQIKKAGLKEIYRVLKEDGKLYFFDFGKPHYIIGYTIIPLFIWTDYLRAHLFGKVPDYFKEAGFRDITLKKKGIFTESYLMYK